MAAKRPGGANRAHDVLRDMFARAILGHRPEAAGNPCTGITRYRRLPRQLLRMEDLARLGAVLRRLEYDWPVKVAAVRLILLTGCRSGEVRHPRWRDVKRDRLMLAESKTGPRHVLLGEAGIVADARLHDLRHNHASHATMDGESLHMAGRLLGHRRATTTNQSLRSSR